MRLRPLLSVVLVLAAARASAAPPAALPELAWRNIGPFRGGRVLAVSGVPGQPERFYFGSVNGGVWETLDAGRTWRPIFDGQPIGSIGALAVAPSDPSVLYVGSGEADMRSDIAQGDGMYRSRDAGRTWAHVGLADTQQIARVLVDPRDARRVFVAALGHPYGPNAERGLFRSTDGGDTWSKVLFRDADTGAVEVAFAPDDPRVMYAALWQTRRTPWNIYPPSSGPGSGLYKSTDGGDTWAPITGHGFPTGPGRIGIALAPSAPRRVYAVVDALDGGLYRSDDAGATWQRTSSDPRIWQRGWYFGGLTVEPSDPDVVYACNTTLYRSSDGGRTFTPVRGAPGGDDYHTLWIDPAGPQRRILAVDQGAVVSVDGGATWSSWYNQPTGQFYHLVTDTRFPYWVYGAQQDSGAAGVPSRTSSRDGINMTHFRETAAGGESDNVAPDPRDPDLVYGGRVDRLDLRTGQTRSLDPTLSRPDERYRATWTLPLVFSRRDPRVLYFARQQVYRTEDGGEHWSTISPDLTREAPGVPANLDPATAAHDEGTGPRRGVVYALAPSRLADHDLWAGTDDGRVWRTRDEGAHWAEVTPAALTAWSKVGIVESSPFDAETAYIAVDRHRLDDFTPYVYRTHDGGQTWASITNGLPAGHAVNAVREDPVRRGLLYAGTEKGVFVSFDDGERWQSLQQNLPVTSVRDLEVHGNDLVIATHGRAFWVLDDVTPLRQLADVTAGQPHLFAPAPAVRVRPAGFTGTPLPKDEPMAPNPPAGAVIDYALAAPAAAPVTITIRDAAGALVRRYSSADALPAPRPATDTTDPAWFEPAVPPRTSAGLHRFVWPLRYPAPPSLGSGSAYADGVWAPPGRYVVELAVDGARLTQPLVIEPDPRVSVTPEGYASQVALARRVEALRERVSAARDEADAVTKALRARREGAPPAIAAALAAVADRLDEAAGTDPASNLARWWKPARSLRSLRAVGDTLEALATAVDGADAAPSPDAVAGVNAAEPLAAAAVAGWEAWKTRDLAPLNRRLQSAKVAPLPLKD